MPGGDRLGSVAPPEPKITLEPSAWESGEEGAFDPERRRTKRRLVIGLGAASLGAAFTLVVWLVPHGINFHFGSPGASDSIAGKGSFAQPREFAAELRKLDHEAGGTARVENLGVSGSAFSADFADRDGYEESFMHWADGRSEFDDDSSSKVTGPTVPTARIDPRVPMRLIAAVSRRAGVEPSCVQSLSLGAWGTDGPRWTVVLTEGSRRTWAAKLDGRRLRAVG